MHRRFVISAVILFAVFGPAQASVDIVKLFGQPRALTIDSRVTALRGPRATRQLVLTATFQGEHAVRDITHLVEWKSSDPAVATVDKTGLVRAVGNGKANVSAHVADKLERPTIEITVVDVDKPAPVSFENEIIPVLNRAGCNQGACHGTPNGKGGFKLSLRGYDPAADFLSLTRDAQGRRTNRQNPDASLLLQKPLTQVPHQGGKRFAAGTPEHRLIREWISGSLPADPKDAPTLTRLEVLPARRVVRLVPAEHIRADDPVQWQQLGVIAHYSDGSLRDVTHLCHFSTSDETVAGVTPAGVVQPTARGEAAILVRHLHLIESATLTFLQDQPGFAWPDIKPFNEIDKHIDTKLKLLRIPPSDVCSDQVFIRRVYLDVIGTLPTPGEVRAFLVDKTPNKRAKLIDQLLERPEFAVFWSLKWADLFRVNERFMGDDGVKLLHAWLREKLAKDEPFDMLVKELLIAQGSAKEKAEVNFFRPMPDAEAAAETISQLFLGVRMGCARCHNHPFERWTQEEYFGIAAFFAQVHFAPAPEKMPKDMILRLDPKRQVKHPRTGGPMPPMFPGGAKPEIADDADRREAFADWLIDPKNPFFAKALANRVWFHLLGRGLVEPVDDFRDSNPCSNPPLLDHLASELIRNKYQLEPLIRLILNSRAYQTSADANALNKSDDKYFSRAQVMLYGAEQLLDAICDATGVPEKLPGGTARAIELAGAKTDHPFLKVFNRPARNMPCECERQRDPNLAQALQLIAGRIVQNKLADKNRLSRLIDAKKADREIVEELYLASLSRFPTGRELQSVLKELESADDRRAALEDVAWALINSKEFMYRH